MIYSTHIGIQHKGKTIYTSVGSKAHERFVRSLNYGNFTMGTVPLGDEHRPDLISNLFLNGPEGWALFCEINAVSDPFEGLNVNDEILLP